MLVVSQVFDFIGNLIKPVTKLIDDLVTSEDEKIKLHNELAKIHVGFLQTVVGYEEKMLEQKASIVRAEAEGQSWLQRNWRPITMMVFTTIVAWNYIIAPIAGLDMLPMPDQLWDLLQIGIGGYIAGRSIEKIAPTIAEAMSKRNNNQ